MLTAVKTNKKNILKQTGAAFSDAAWGKLAEYQNLKRRGLLVDQIGDVKKLFTKCLSEGLIPIAYQLADCLHHHYIKKEPNKNEVKRWQQHIDRLYKILPIYQRHRFLSNQIDFSLSPSNETLNMLREACEELEPLLIYGYVDINTKVYMMQCWLFIIENNPEKLIKVSETAVEFFKTKKIDKSVNILSLSIYAYIIDRQYITSIEILLLCKEKVLKNSHNYVTFCILAVRNALYNKKYIEAAELLEQIPRPRNPLLIEQVKLLKGYISFLSLLNITKPTKNYRLYKLINETPISEKDKKGANISLVVLKLITLLVKTPNKLVDKVESWKQYNFNYLRKLNRHYYFINSLIRLVTANNPTPILDKRIKNHPTRMTDIEIEIIPYEDLWGLLINSLSNKH